MRIARFDGEHPHGVPADAEPVAEPRATAVGVATPPGGTAIVDAGPDAGTDAGPDADPDAVVDGEVDTAEIAEDPPAPPLTPPAGLSQVWPEVHPGTPEGPAKQPPDDVSARHLAVLVAGGGVAAAAGAGAVLFRALGGDDAVDGLRPSTGVEAGDADRRPPAGAAAGAPLRLPKGLSTDLLVRRVSYGATPGMLAAVDKMGAQAWLARQLDPGSLKDPGGAEIVARFPDIARSTAEVRKRLDTGDPQVMLDLGAAHVGRAVWSSRQLLEVMVDLWSNHLNVPCPDRRVWDTRHRYDADVVRKQALGRFSDLLVASATHPAMLVSLDGASSVGDEPNEAYARELLETHTVGAAAGFTEADVRATALLMTGWRVSDGEAVYDPARHYAGKISVLGFTNPDASVGDGPAAQQALLRYLATHPGTARRIARKLAVRFVADDPPDALVDRLAQVYLAGRTAIVPVLTALFGSDEFATSAGQKVRRPFERLAATTRMLNPALGEGKRGLLDLYRLLAPAGHQPLAWPGADGYPDVAAAWRSPATALEDLNSTANLVHGWWPDRLDLPGPGKLLDDPPDNRDDTIDAVARRVLGRDPDKVERTAVRTLLDGTELPVTFREGTWEQEETVALTATLLFSSPAHLRR